MNATEEKQIGEKCISVLTFMKKLTNNGETVEVAHKSTEWEKIEACKWI